MTTEVTDILSSIHIFIYAFICFMNVLMHLAVYKNKRSYHYFISGVFFSIGCTVFTAAFYLSNTLILLPRFFSFTLHFTYCIGPCIYLVFLSMTDPLIHIKKRHILHFVPALLIFLLFIPVYLFPETSLLHIKTTAFMNREFLSMPIRIWTFILPYFQTVLYSVFIIFRNYHIWKFKNLKTWVFRTVFIFTIILAVIFIALILGAFLFDFIFFKFVYILFLSILLFLHYIGIRVPDCFDILGRELRKHRYEKIVAKHTDDSILIKRLNEFLEVDKIYKNSELSIEKLSVEMKIPAYELSAVINKHWKMNFRRLINMYRLENVKTELIDNPEKLILEIAFASGFNSTTTFYKCFQDETGMAPKEFRKTKSY